MSNEVKEQEVTNTLPQVDINQIIQQALKKMHEENFIQQVIEKQLKNTVEKVIEYALESYSDFGRSLRKEVEKNLAINFKQLSLNTYNQLLLNMINQEMDQLISEKGLQKIKENLEEILAPEDKEIKLSELIEQIVEEDADLEKLRYGDALEITVHINNSYKYLKHLYIDAEPGLRDFECKYQITIDAETGKIESVKIDDSSFDSKVFMGNLYGVERKLFALWSAGSKLVIDDYQTEFFNPEYED